MEFILTTAYAALFIFLIGKWAFFRIEGIPLNYVKAGFVIKLLAGISLGLIYTYYYTDRLTADTFKFFDDSKVLYNSFFTNKGDFFRMMTGIGSGSHHLEPYYNTMKNWYDVYSPFNDNRTMIRFNALIRFISFGYYYVHVVFVAFLSLTGIVAIVKVLRKEYPFLAIEFLGVLVLTPSVLFWGSGLLKDSLVFFVFGITIYKFDELLRNGSLSKWILFFALFFLLMITKFQIFLLSFPLFVGWFWSVKRKTNAMITIPAAVVLFSLLLIAIGMVIPAFSLPDLLAQKQASFLKLAVESGAGSIISIPELHPTTISLIINAPLGFFTALMRPFLTDSASAITIVAAIENTMILLFIIWCSFHFTFRNIKNKTLVWFLIMYVITSYTLIGEITPVLGAMVRYKAHALPFLVIIFVITSSENNQSLIKKTYTKVFSSLWK